MAQAYDIIKRPIITERSVSLMEANKYVFEIDVKATKSQVKYAIETIFNVKVASVNTMNMKGKKKRVGQHVGRTSDWKKAIVTLTEDSKAIEFFEGM